MPSTVTVTVEQGGAGFAANEDLSVKKVDPEGRCDEAGVEVGMFVIEFQERPLEPGTTWATLRQMVKGAERPWTFQFAPFPLGSSDLRAEYKAHAIPLDKFKAFQRGTDALADDESLTGALSEPDEPLPLRYGATSSSSPRVMT